MSCGGFYNANRKDHDSFSPAHASAALTQYDEAMRKWAARNPQPTAGGPAAEQGIRRIRRRMRLRGDLDGERRRGFSIMVLSAEHCVRAHADRAKFFPDEDDHAGSRQTLSRHAHH